MTSDARSTTLRRTAMTMYGFRFSRALAFTLEAEGGFSHRSDDLGGETFRGITRRLATAHGWPANRPLQQMPDVEVARIYHDEFWGPMRLGAITSLTVATEIFDTAVNLGPGRAVRIAQQAAELIGFDPGPIDGRIGPRTLGAINRAAIQYERHLLGALNGFQFEHYVKRLREDPEHARAYIRGWTARLHTPDMGGEANHA